MQDIEHGGKEGNLLSPRDEEDLQIGSEAEQSGSGWEGEGEDAIADFLETKDIRYAGEDDIPGKSTQL